MSQLNQEYGNDWNKRLAEELIQELPEMAEEIKMQLCIPHLDDETTKAPAPILASALPPPQVTAKPKSLLGELKEFRVKKRTYPAPETSAQVSPKHMRFEEPSAQRKSIIEVRLTSEPNRYFDERAATSDGVVRQHVTVKGGTQTKISAPNMLNAITVKVGQVVENTTDIVLELAVEHRQAVQKEVLDLAVHKNVERREMPPNSPNLRNQPRMPENIERNIPRAAPMHILPTIDVRYQPRMPEQVCTMERNSTVVSSSHPKQAPPTADRANLGYGTKNVEVCNQPMERYYTTAVSNCDQIYIPTVVDHTYLGEQFSTAHEKAAPKNLSNESKPSEPLEIKIDPEPQNVSETRTLESLLVISTPERQLKVEAQQPVSGSISRLPAAAIEEHASPADLRGNQQHSANSQLHSATSDLHSNNLTPSSMPPEKAEPTPIPQRNYGGGGAPATAAAPAAAEVFMDYEDVNQAPEELTAEEAELDKRMRSSGATFLQHLPCFKLPVDSSAANVITKCRECRRRSNMAGQTSQDVYCRFIDFRRLQYSPEGILSVSGFPNPYTEPTEEDINIWQPNDTTEPTAGYMDIQVCRYILLHAGDQFCYLWRQEAQALKLHENPNTRIAWKKVVRGTREICDVCDTTLFNFHWTCDKCGFGVCLDCFKDHKESRKCNKTRDEAGLRMRDEFLWLFCSVTPTQQTVHERNELMLTQIITGDSLNVLGRMLHEVRALWQIPQLCGCLLSKQQLPDDFDMNDIIDDMIKGSELEQRTAASSLATKATFIEQERLEKIHDKKLKFARAHSIEYVAGRTQTKQSLDEDPITTAFDNFTHINFLRKGLAGLRKFLPPRAMSLAHSRILGPGVPHEWLCDGKLLRLTNPIHPDNRLLFQDVWKCGQPVMISQVAKSLNLDLWRPDAFCQDFGDKPNDLINCLNGNLVPNQPMRNFWEGFECIKKRLLDANGKPMLLKLKDWPPGDDFAEILPTRYADLMNGLPLPEYTLRTGNLNIASCLPKLFVPPDLGPKMYNAYGSALHPDKGTTNLHLDISDAVNIMVYVGIPKDADETFQSSATQRAIAIGGCDYITRTRSQNRNVVPGALWHIFPARDADKIRDLLNRVTLENGFRLEPDHDPIHDQNWYLDDRLRARLFREYGVEAYPIVQCLGDAVFIPAGAPHQVQNLHNCIKVAEDFVSPENITHCYHLTHEFRRLSHSHTNHEDKLQIKNIIYHAIKDCCTILNRALKKRIVLEVEKKKRLMEEFKKKQAEEAAKKAEEALAAMEEEENDADEGSSIEESSSENEDTDSEDRREDSTDAGDEREDSTDSESVKQKRLNAKFRSTIVALKNKSRAGEVIHEDSEEETEDETETRSVSKRSNENEDSDGGDELRRAPKRSKRHDSVEKEITEEPRIEESRNLTHAVHKVSEEMTEDTDDTEQRNKETFNRMQISSDMNEDTDDVAERSEGRQKVEEINHKTNKTEDKHSDDRVAEETHADDVNGENLVSLNELDESEEEMVQERNSPELRNETEDPTVAQETDVVQVVKDSLVVEDMNEEQEKGLIDNAEEENCVSEIAQNLTEADEENSDSERMEKLLEAEQDNSDSDRKQELVESEVENPDTERKEELIATEVENTDIERKEELVEAEDENSDSERKQELIEAEVENSDIERNEELIGVEEENSDTERKEELVVAEEQELIKADVENSDNKRKEELVGAQDENSDTERKEELVEAEEEKSGSESKEALVEAEEEQKAEGLNDAEHENAMNTSTVSDYMDEYAHNSDAVIDGSLNGSNFEDQNEAIDDIREMNTEAYNYSTTSETENVTEQNSKVSEGQAKPSDSQGLTENLTTKITNEDTDDAEPADEILRDCKHDEDLIEDKDDSMGSYGHISDIVEHMDYGKEIYKIKEGESIADDINESNEDEIEDSALVSAIEELHGENINEDVNEAAEENSREAFSYSPQGCVSKDANDAVELDEDIHETLSNSSEDAVKYVVKNILESGNANAARSKPPLSHTDSSSNAPPKDSRDTPSDEPLNYSKDAASVRYTDSKDDEGQDEGPPEFAELIEEHLDDTSSLVSHGTSGASLNHTKDSEDLNTTYIGVDGEILNRITNSESLSEDPLNYSADSDGISDQPLNLSN